jgi:hypothetical protein
MISSVNTLVVAEDDSWSVVLVVPVLEFEDRAERRVERGGLSHLVWDCTTRSSPYYPVPNVMNYLRLLRDGM